MCVIRVHSSFLNIKRANLLIWPNSDFDLFEYIKYISRALPVISQTAVILLKSSIATTGRDLVIHNDSSSQIQNRT